MLLLVVDVAPAGVGDAISTIAAATATDVVNVVVVAAVVDVDGAIVIVAASTAIDVFFCCRISYRCCRCYC